MIKIREANHDDLEDVLELWANFTEYLEKKEPDFFNLKPEATEIYRGMLDKMIADNDIKVWVGDDNGKLVAYHIASIRYPGDVFVQEPYGHISDLYLKEEYRGQQLGERLVEETKKWLQQQGVKKLDVKTFSDNPGGLAFWESCGFDKMEVSFKSIL